MPDALSPLALTDSQLNAILAAAHPLPWGKRNDFLEEITRILQAMPELGDGSLHRVIVQTQRKFFDPPDLEAHMGKYR
jgi:hypothetical protein